jgi:hypothetical protein
VWITRKEFHGENAGLRFGLYVGPYRQNMRLPGGAKFVDSSTSIEELHSSTSATADQGVPLQLWWQDLLNLVQRWIREAKTKEHRKDDDATSHKRRRCDESASPVEHDTCSYPADCGTCNGELTVHISEIVMTDEDINDAFNDLDTPVSEFIIHREAGIMQKQKGTSTMLPPLDLLRGLRDPVDPTISTDLLLWEISASPGPLMDGSVAHLSRGHLEDAFRRQAELISHLRA